MFPTNRVSIGKKDTWQTSGSPTPSQSLESRPRSLHLEVLGCSCTEEIGELLAFGTKPAETIRLKVLKTQPMSCVPLTLVFLQPLLPNPFSPCHLQQTTKEERTETFCVLVVTYLTKFGSMIRTKKLTVVQQQVNYRAYSFFLNKFLHALIFFYSWCFVLWDFVPPTDLCTCLHNQGRELLHHPEETPLFYYHY